MQLNAWGDVRVKYNMLKTWCRSCEAHRLRQLDVSVTSLGLQPEQRILASLVNGFPVHHINVPYSGIEDTPQDNIELCLVTGFRSRCWLFSGHTETNGPG